MENKSEAPCVEPRKPREIWVNEFKDCLEALMYETEAEADKYASDGRVRCVKFVEVIEE